MKLFLVYLLGMFLFGLLSRRRQQRFILILGVCLLVIFSYYFLNQI